MTSVHELAASVFAWLAASALDLAVLVVLVALLQRGLRRWLTPRWSYALWLLVPLRLAIPVAVESPLSLQRLAEQRPQDSAPAAIAIGDAETYDTTFPDLDPFSRERASRRTVLIDKQGEVPAVPPAMPPRTPRFLAPDDAWSAVPAALFEPSSQGPGDPPAWPWQSTLVAVWLAGAAGFFGWTVVRHRRFARAVRDEPIVSDERVARLLRRAAEEAGVRRTVEVLGTSLVASPAVFGARRPRILLPPRVLESFDDEALLAVFRHELAHVRCGDGAANWALAVAQALQWHHPLVWCALARLRASRESARDWMALACSSAPAHTYGDTLIRLLENLPRSRVQVPVPAAGILEGHADLRRRVTMITRFRPASRRGLVLGAFLLAGVVSLTFTRPPLPPAVAQETVGADFAAGAEDSDLRRIHVERKRPMPDWEIELREKLAQPVTVNIEQGSVKDVLDFLRKEVPLNVIVAPDLRDEVANQEARLVVEDVSVERVLRWALRPAGLDFCVSGHAIYVGPRNALPYQLERRFYNLKPLLSMRDLFGEPVEPDGIVELILSFVATSSWEMRENVSIQYLKGLLLVDQTAEVHEGVEGFLNLLLNRGELPPVTVPVWRTQLDERLATSVSVSHAGKDLAAAARSLEEQLHVRVVVPEEEGKEVAIDLQLEAVPARQVVDWMARLSGLAVSFQEGAIVLTREPPLLVRAYSVHSLLRGLERDPIDMDTACELMHDGVSPTSWEQQGALVIPWGDLLVVAQSEAVHAEIEEFFAALRRTLEE